ncbi:Metallo-hydrolase/oxidoreductase [Ceraceosorus guamensis]|uniref:Metallo-hydrolase/oxidoreductase n=1 Tax=Ceraceosorus guamensis TaxID=1522189 RepID=A0A316VZK5_9BASI|nr:Metallo-hydrolase/oxidoreductase [Ceraceosorus guamensis]PWN41863.1 Metallo-hydrolase/oxidoreductase [Ceraceosorus guamensis]
MPDTVLNGRVSQEASGAASNTKSDATTSGLEHPGEPRGASRVLGRDPEPTEIGTPGEEPRSQASESKAVASVVTQQAEEGHAKGDSSSCYDAAPSQGKQKRTLWRRGNSAVRDTSSDSDDAAQRQTKELYPYTLTLKLRSVDPAKDAATLPRSKLPSHHVPTLVSRAALASDQVLKRAARSIHPLKADADEKAALPAAWDAVSERTRDRKTSKRITRVVRSAVGKVAPSTTAPDAGTVDLVNANSGALASLTFENPWDSFRKPSVADALNGGLKWGLPRGYEQGGGRSRYRGGGRRRKGPGAESANDVGPNIEVIKPDWGERRVEDEETDLQVQARITWLGHASILVQLPQVPRPRAEEQEEAVSGAIDDASDEEKIRATRRPFNILIDPVFSERCSPSQVAGPIRHTPTPCGASDLPPIDVILISHSHYDHLDLGSIQELLKTRGKALHVLVPLGNKAWFEANGFKKEQVSELDWWDEAWFSISKEGNAGYRIICTPAQHGSGRGPGDKDSTLWSSWLIERVLPKEPTTTTAPTGVLNKVTTTINTAFTAANNVVAGRQIAKGVSESTEKAADEVTTSPKVSTLPIVSTFDDLEVEAKRRYRIYFAGDTGLRAHNESRKPRERYPACPAFRDISLRYGVPHVLLLPISVGSSLSYFRSWDPLPRRYSPFPRVESPLTSAIHMDAFDAVDCARIMALRIRAGQEASKSASREDDEEVSRREDRARALGPKNGVTCLAVHYGTFVRNSSQTMDDLRDLAQACAKAASNGSASSITHPHRPHLHRHNLSTATAATGRTNGTAQGDLARTKSSSANVLIDPTNIVDMRFIRTREGAFERSKGKEEDIFLVSHQGETVWFPIST